MIQNPASKLARLDRRKREELDPFPSISPTTGIAEQVKYKVDGKYIIDGDHRGNCSGFLIAVVCGIRIDLVAYHTSPVGQAFAGRIINAHHQRQSSAASIC